MYLQLKSSVISCEAAFHAVLVEESMKKHQRGAYSSMYKKDAHTDINQYSLNLNKRTKKIKKTGVEDH